MANMLDLAWSTVATAPSPATTGNTLVVAAGDGALFPAASLPAKALLCPPGVIPTKANSERVMITGRSTDTLTITRDQGNYNGGVGRSVAAGWIIMQTPFADDFFNTSLITGETPVGSINGTNQNFTTASTFRTGSLRVFLNGQRLTAGSSNDYTENANGTGFTMTTNNIPQTGDVLLVDYQSGDSVYSVGGNSIITDEVPTGTKNGTNTQFTTARAYIPGTLEVYLNGIKQIRTTHITETTPASGIFNLDVAPASNDVLTVNYQFNLNPSSNADTVDGVHASDYTDQTGVLVSDYGGWRKILAAPTYVSATTFTVPGDLSAVFSVGCKIKLNNTSLKYFYCVSASYSSGTGLTTVTVTAGSDYSLANAAITNLMISYDASPQGFPFWFNYTPTLSTPGGAFTSASAVGKFNVIGRQVNLKVDVTITTIGTATGVWFSVPIATATSSTGGLPVYGRENAVNGKMLEGKFQSSTTIGLSYYDNTSPTASGLILICNGFYEI